MYCCFNFTPDVFDMLMIRYTDNLFASVETCSISNIKPRVRVRVRVCTCQRVYDCALRCAYISIYGRLWKSSNEYETCRDFLFIYLFFRYNNIHNYETNSLEWNTYNHLFMQHLLSGDTLLYSGPCLSLSKSVFSSSPTEGFKLSFHFLQSRLTTNLRVASALLKLREMQIWICAFLGRRSFDRIMRYL